MTDSDEHNKRRQRAKRPTSRADARAGRRRADLTLEQLSTELRIEVRQLQALEQDRSSGSACRCS